MVNATFTVEFMCFLLLFNGNYNNLLPERDSLLLSPVNEFAFLRNHSHANLITHIITSCNKRAPKLSMEFARMANYCDHDEHLGHIFLSIMKKRCQDDIFVIDGWTGEQVTVGEILSNVVRLAAALRHLGLRAGAPLALAGRNHTALRLPYYAALLNGLPVCVLDPLYDYDEVKTLLKITQPKIAFVQIESYEMYRQVAERLGIEVRIVTFDEGEHSMSKFLETYGDDASIYDFEPAEFNASKAYAFLVSTSGTSGTSKVAAISHAKIIPRLKIFIAMKQYNGSSPKCVLCYGYPQWISAYLNSLAWPLMNYTLLQSSRPGPRDGTHLVDLINKYRPSMFLGSIRMMFLALNTEKHCDFSCFEEIIVGGMNVYKKTLMELKARTPGKVVEGYGLTEAVGQIMQSDGNQPLGCVGTPIPYFTFKLMDPSTGEEIKEPYVNGELWIMGPLFEEYYNDPQETAKAFHEGWYKTGDLMYRDELDRYYFADRLKMMFQYKHYNIVPSELEEVLMSHPEVLDGTITSVPHEADGRRAVACVVTRPGVHLTAQQIKDFIADALPAEKHLHGGVVFLDQVPRNSAGKVSHSKLNEILKHARIE